MNKIGLALTAIMFMGLVVFMAPNIFALNRGKVLRNIALWLAIFAGLGLVYQMLYGNKPPSMQMLIPGAAQPQEDAPAPAGDKRTDNKSFTPPGE